MTWRKLIKRLAKRCGLFLEIGSVRTGRSWKKRSVAHRHLRRTRFSFSHTDSLRYSAWKKASRLCGLQPILRGGQLMRRRRTAKTTHPTRNAITNRGQCSTDQRLPRFLLHPCRAVMNTISCEVVCEFFDLSLRFTLSKLNIA